MSKTLAGLFRLTRPLNCGIAALSVLVGAVTAGLLGPSAEIAVAALAAACIAAAGNVYNDVRDVGIDRINRPDRPLPAGEVGPRMARVTAILLAAAGLAGSGWLGLLPLLVAVFTLVLLYLYNRYLKPTALWGNLVVAIAAAGAFPFGALAAGSWGRSWIPAGFALLFHLGREIIKDLEDVPGDQAAGARTLPLRWGTAVAVRSSISIFLILFVLTMIPAFMGTYGVIYLALVATMNLAVAVTLVGLRREPGSPTRFPASVLLKGCMFLGLAAVVAGELL